MGQAVGDADLGDDPAGHRVEISSTRVAFSPSADNVTISGLVVEKYAIPPQMGAIGDQYPRTGWRVENNEVRLNHGTGITVSSGGVVRDNHVHHNGQKGIGATGAGILVEGNEIAHNNYAHVDSGGEAGGTKFALTTGLVVRDNCVHDNYVEVDPAFGHGITIIWQDRADEAGNPYRATGSQVHDFAPTTTEIYLTNSFRANTYHAPDPAGLRFVWDNASRTFTEFQSRGREVGGGIDGAVIPARGPAACDRY